ncbi:MAG: tetratricopeptide repeat protein [Deltaproteobacteria bacterium]|nr:tetratricopeptide repeat protein [Deltaproteobacteria bacterium]
MTRARRLLSLLIVVLFATACRTDIQSGIDEANDLLYRKQYVASERLYRKLLKRLENQGDLDDEEDAQRLLTLDRLGKINALYLHDFNQAITDYQALIRFYPKTDQAFAARATMADIYHHKLGDLQAAVDSYQRLVADFPERAEIHRAQLEIANAYFQLKNYEQARTESENLINRWPQSPEALQARFQIANSYYVQARYAEAIAVYERLLESKPDKALSALVLFELGNCFQELEQSDRALAYYYACLADHPDPMLVQRKIRRVRTRTQKARPVLELQLPDYLKERLAAAKRAAGESTGRMPGVMEAVAPKVNRTEPVPEVPDDGQTLRVKPKKKAKGSEPGRVEDAAIAAPPEPAQEAAPEPEPTP